MTDAQAAARFQALGVTSMTDIWRSAQPWCEKLRRAGWLESVAALLGIGYVNEFHPSDDVDYYLERCRRVGDFKAWCMLDKVAAQMARRHGLMPNALLLRESVWARRSMRSVASAVRAVARCGTWRG